MVIRELLPFCLFIFLDKNNFLFRKTGEKKINDNALTTLALLIAISDPNDKEKIIKIITNLIALWISIFSYVSIFLMLLIPSNAEELANLHIDLC